MTDLRCVVIDGEIGAGKSTLCHRLEKRHDVVQAVIGVGRRIVAVYECIEEWQSMGVFELMCRDPVTWGAAFQLIAIASRIARWRVMHDRYENDPDVCLLLERAPPADRFVFEHVLRERGAITPQDHDAYIGVYDRMWAARPRNIDRVGVLVCDDFAEITRRIRGERARDAEDAYDDGYLRELRARYVEMINSDEWPLRGVTVRLDGAQNFRDCDRALCVTFAQLCGVNIAVAEKFACTCGRCAH
jgi:deoxyadenosine/deoxycytidine kinase